MHNYFLTTDFTDYTDFSLFTIHFSLKTILSPLSSFLSPLLIVHCALQKTVISR